MIKKIFFTLICLMSTANTISMVRYVQIPTVTVKPGATFSQGQIRGTELHLNLDEEEPITLETFGDLLDTTNPLRICVLESRKPNLTYTVLTEASYRGLPNKGRNPLTNQDVDQVILTSIDKNQPAAAAAAASPVAASAANPYATPIGRPSAAGPYTAPRQREPRMLETGDPILPRNGFHYHWLSIPSLNDYVLITTEQAPDAILSADGTPNFRYISPDTPSISLARGLYYWKSDAPRGTLIIGNHDARSIVRPRPNDPKRYQYDKKSRKYLTPDSDSTLPDTPSLLHEAKPNRLVRFK